MGYAACSLAVRELHPDLLLVYGLLFGAAHGLDLLGGDAVGTAPEHLLGAECVCGTVLVDQSRESVDHSGQGAGT